MVEIAVFVLALVAVFAMKAASIMLTRDEIVENSKAFCWTKAQPSDAEPVWNEKTATDASGEQVPVRVYGRRPSIA